jgi:hypothetical protein
MFHTGSAALLRYRQRRSTDETDVTDANGSMVSSVQSPSFLARGRSFNSFFTSERGMRCLRERQQANYWLNLDFVNPVLLIELRAQKLQHPVHQKVVL